MLYEPPTREMRDEFHGGTSRCAYKMFGARLCHTLHGDEWQFSVWAPNAKAVSLVGEFNYWRRGATPMSKNYDGTWEARLPASVFDIASDKERYSYEGAEEKIKTYKYAIEAQDGSVVVKADPYALQSELRPGTASKLCDLGGHEWKDAEFMKKRAAWNPYASPLNIYEMHLGSWKRHEDGSLYTYLETADELIPYITDMGYTHIELLPIMEHPLDMSWGYQVTGYYSATARFGTPLEFMEFIDRCHQANIGVILDWVPAHFPRDEFGLRRFDGTALYEHPDPRRGDMKQWGTHMFDFARGEVCSFLLSNAWFWFGEFHADGLRVDAVSSMLYYDFCREEGDWLPNRYGGHENLDAIAFLRRLNETIYHDFPGAMMIAEESSAYPMVTKPTYMGGLGFGFKWNMGWMNDILFYIEKEHIYRKWHHSKLTFSLMYAFSENYILPFSHDEVVHGKHSMLDKQPGDLWQKFAGLRALYGYMMAHPGKKLLFMGSEFGHFIEWKYDDQLDWFLLLYDRHPEMQKCVQALNHFYLEHSEMWQVDTGWDGFQWLVPDDSDNSVIAFTRSDRSGKTIISVTNFTPQFLPEYRLPLPAKGKICEVLNTDRAEFGGSNQYNAYELTAQEGNYNGMPYSALICVPPLSSVYFSYVKEMPEKKHSRSRTSSSEQLEYIQSLKEEKEAEESAEEPLAFSFDKNSPKLKLEKEINSAATKYSDDANPFTAVVNPRGSEMKRHRTAKADLSDTGAVKPSSPKRGQKGISDSPVKPKS